MRNKSLIIYTDYKYIFNFLSDAELGQLFRMLIEYAETGQEPLSDNQKIMNAYAYVHNRLDAIENRKQINAENGKKGGNPNFTKGQPNPYYSHKADISENITEDNRNITDNNPAISKDKPNDKDKDNVKKEDSSDELSSKETTAAKVGKLMAFMEQFALFWRTFPNVRKGNMEKARKAYERVIREKRATPEQIQAACEAYAASEEANAEGGRFCKGCAAWLNDDRFNVKYSEFRPKTTSGKSNEVLKDFLEKTGGQGG